MSNKKTEGHLSSEELHELYDMMSEPMISFDCGELCLDAGEGTPFCCDHDNFHPLLFADELKWLQKHKEAGWEKFKPRTKFEKREVKTLCDHLVYGNCAGIENCNRDHRALVCRLFPFEPHVDSEGNVVGLAFITNDATKCPLVAKPLDTFRPEYISASMKVWQRLIDTYPDEKELYISESRKREKRARKKRRELRLLR